jgi:Cu+-exporting ATPase
MKQTVKIEGMSCAHCARRVEKALGAIPGVSAVVHLESGTAELSSDGEIDFSAIERAVADAGYKAAR